MEIKEKNIEDLIFSEYNPRKLTKEQEQHLTDSIKRFGLVDPIIINKHSDRKNIIIGGHQRIKIAKKLEYKEVPCVEVKLNRDQERELNIRLNKNNGEWDWKLLANNFDVGELMEWGFDEEDFENFEDFDAEVKGKIDDDEIPEVEEPICKKGDLWKLGEHRLLCGDATKKEDVERLMDGEKADMVFTDPPYKLDTKGGGILKDANSMKQIRNNKVDEFNPECLSLYAETNIFCHNKPLIKKYIELSERHKKSFDLCFYKKTNTAPNYGGHLMTDTEYIIVIGKQSPNKGLDKEYYSKGFIGKKDNDNKLSYSKPVALCEKFIKLYSNKSVLDMFLGSGSTLIACEKTNRKCYGMELDEHYCDVIINRWEQYTGKKADKIG